MYVLFIYDNVNEAYVFTTLISSRNTVNSVSTYPIDVTIDATIEWRDAIFPRFRSEQTRDIRVTKNK